MRGFRFYFLAPSLASLTHGDAGITGLPIASRCPCSSSVRASDALRSQSILILIISPSRKLTSLVISGVNVGPHYRSFPRGERSHPGSAVAVVWVTCSR